MKKISIFLVLLSVSISSFAQKITKEAALEKAEIFIAEKMRSNSSARRTSKISKTNVNLTLADSKDEYFVFNKGNEAGYVIVSGDERSEPILGYSDEGNFDAENMPEGLRTLLLQYKEEIQYLQKHNILAHSPEVNATQPAIEPLIKTKWGQGHPYNTLCPLQYGQHCVTGCTATAVAQVMNYYQWPKSTTMTIPDYEYSNFSYISAGELPPITFDWDHMPTSYTSDPVEQKAVSELMLYCGGASCMSYGFWASYASYNPENYNKYFKYSLDCKYIDKINDGYSTKKWENMLLNELMHGRPMLYEASNGYGAHAFICDGYDGEGRFHFNFGWDGQYDGYYKITAIDPDVVDGYFFPEGPYYDFQRAYFGFRPDDGKELSSDDAYGAGYTSDLPYQDKYTISCNELSYEDSEKGYWTYTAKLSNDTDNMFEMYTNVSFYNKESSFYSESKFVVIEPNSEITQKFYIRSNDFWQSYIDKIDGRIVAGNFDAMLWDSPKSGLLVEKIYTCVEKKVIPENITAADLRSAVGSSYWYKPNNNPNCLYLLAEDDAYNRDGLYTGKMIARNGKIDSYSVTDQYPVTVPVEINAGNAQFLYHFTEGSQYGTIVLPFVPANVGDYDFYEFVGDEKGKVYFCKTTDIKRNTPYIIRRPDGVSEIAFTASNCDLFTRYDKVYGNYKMFCVNCKQEERTDAYVFDGNNNTFVWTKTSTIAPHRAFFSTFIDDAGDIGLLDVVFIDNKADFLYSLLAVHQIKNTTSNIVTRESSDQDFSPVSIEYWWYSDDKTSIDYEVCLGVYKDGECVANSSSLSSNVSKYNTIGTTVSLNFKSYLPDGIYRIFPVARIEGSNGDFKPMYKSDSKYLKAEIRTNTLTLTQIVPEDVNADGYVDIRDVTSLIDILNNTKSTSPTHGDINEDGKVDVEDVTALIDIILKNQANK